MQAQTHFPSFPPRRFAGALCALLCASLLAGCAGLPSLEDRDAMIEHLRKRGVYSVFHYQPLHLSPMGLKHGGRAGQCPVTEALGDRLTRLPMFFELTDQELDRVIDAVTSFHVAARRVQHPLPRAA